MRYALFAAKRLAIALPLALAATLAVFLLLRVSGVSPINVMVGQSRVTEDVRASLTEQFGLDKPLLVQYVDWLGGVLRGDFGVDYVGRQSVSLLIGQRIATTLGLVAFTIAIGLPSGVLLGIVAALHRNTWLDRVVCVIALVLAAIPGFLVGVALLILLAGVAPALSFVGAITTPGEYVSRLALPALVLSLHVVGIVFRVTRASMIEQLRSPYYTGLLAEGLPHRIIVRHCFRNAFTPVLTVGSLMIGAVLAGTVLVESVFSLPGLSGLLIEGVKAHNYPVVQAVVLIFIVVFIVGNVIVESLYPVVDPRVADASSKEVEQ